MTILQRILLASLALTLAGSAAAGYPEKPVKIVEGFGPGGGSDIFLRTILPKLSENLGQAVIVDYRPGAGGNIAMEAVAKAAPDGYTLLMGFPGLATNPSLYEKLPFNPLRDFAPISLVGTVANVLVVNPDVPAHTVQELIALARSQPGKLNFASPGVGTTQHLAAELLKLSTGIDIVHIPYKGGSQAQTDVLAGQTQMMFNVVPSALPLIKAGKLRALAVTGKASAEALPEVPTMIEAGVPGYTAITWNGILAPAGTPKEVVAKLSDALARTLNTPEMKEAVAKTGQEVAWSTPEEFAAFLSEETEKWRKVIDTTGLKPQ